VQTIHSGFHKYTIGMLVIVCVISLHILCNTTTVTLQLSSLQVVQCSVVGVISERSVSTVLLCYALRHAAVEMDMYIMQSSAVYEYIRSAVWWCRRLTRHKHAAVAFTSTMMTCSCCVQSVRVHTFMTAHSQYCLLDAAVTQCLCNIGCTAIFGRRRQ
jgi:hypothetical protein